MKLFGRQIASADLALLAAGVLGVLAYVLFLPGAHPDSTARYAFTPDEIEEHARTFLEQRGYPTGDLDLNAAELKRDEDLLNALQRDLGRPRALHLLADSTGTWPAYYWDVSFEGPLRPAGGETVIAVGEDGELQEADVDLHLTQGGQVYELTLSDLRGVRAEEPGTVQQRHLDREALAAALPRGKEGPPPLETVPDSVLARYIAFDFDATPADSLAEAPDGQTAEAIVEMLRQHTGQTPQTFRIPSLQAEHAVAMARLHLQDTPLGALFADSAALHADSVWIPPGTDERVAAVRFQTEQHGQVVRADVEVFATGGLRTLDTSFNPEQDDDGMSARSWLEVGGLVLAVLIGLGLLVAFFRRLSERMIDVRAGIIDAVVMGLLLVGLMFLGDATFAGEEASTLQRIGAMALGGGFAFAFLTLFAFPFVSAADAVGRAAFAEKMLSMSMVRRLAIRNRFVGAALLRGAALTGVLLGLGVLGLRLLPQALLHLGNDLIGSEAAHPLGIATVLSGFVSYGLLLLIVGLGAFLQRHAGTPAAVVAGVAVLLALVQYGAGGGLSLAPVGYNVLLGGLAGAVLGGTLVRYDALTVFTGLFLAALVSQLEEGWLVTGSPVQDDLLIGLFLIAALILLGFIGVWSGETGREAEDYTPSYLKELAEQERLQRDIEIAQQVQRDFLPRRMPQVEGLDLAALCLPAREVGGDYYDFVELPNGRLAVVIGDVSGKGIEASFYMTLAKGFLQTLAEEERPPAEVLRRLNVLFRRNAPNGTFITMIYGIVDPAAGTFRFARAGHNPLMHWHAAAAPDERADGDVTNGRAGASSSESTVHLVRPRGMAIGLTDAPRFDDVLDEVTLPLHPGDTLVLYTDGFPEARGSDGREYGEQRLRERVQQRGGRPARQLLQMLADDVHSFVESAGRHDDMTMVVIKRPAPSGEEEHAQAVRQAPASPST